MRKRALIHRYDDEADILAVAKNGYSQVQGYAKKAGDFEILVVVPTSKSKSELAIVADATSAQLRTNVGTSSAGRSDHDAARVNVSNIKYTNIIWVQHSVRTGIRWSGEWRAKAADFEMRWLLQSADYQALWGNYPEPSDADNGADDDGFTPGQDDERATAFREIRARRGQQEFRDALRARYGDSCMICGCPLMDIVEAAHIKPYRGDRDNHPANGLLLRADLHTLFDLDLIGIEPETLLVRVHPEARAAGYSDIEGRGLRCSGAAPSPQALTLRWEKFSLRLAQTS